MGHLDRTPLERFMEKVQEENAADPCWLWTGALNSRGYGHFGVGSRVVRAHRWAYEHFVGPIPEGLTVDHLCEQKRCVNPEHMEAVTPEENHARWLLSRRLTRVVTS